MTQNPIDTQGLGVAPTGEPEFTPGPRPGKDATALEVYQYALYQNLVAGDARAYVDTFAVDGVFELPFAPPGFPNKIEGREEIYRVMSPGYEVDFGRNERTLLYKTIHETTDPNVVVVEVSSIRRNKETGEGSPMKYVHIVTTKDGEIILFRDYASHAAIPEGWKDIIEGITQRSNDA